MSGLDLLPCPNPWCRKSAPDTEKRHRFGGYTVFCHTCHIDCGTHDEPAEAIAAWNRRAPPAEPGNPVPGRRG